MILNFDSSTFSVGALAAVPASKLFFEEHIQFAVPVTGPIVGVTGSVDGIPLSKIYTLNTSSVVPGLKVHFHYHKISG